LEPSDFESLDFESEDFFSDAFDALSPSEEAPLAAAFFLP